MASEVIKLNLIPKGEMPVFHASQFDTGRLITCELYRGEDAYSVPEGYTVELHCRKVDNNIVTMASTLINDNVVTFTSTEQLTACNGNNLCEVAILDEGYRIGTLNFILEVEIDPLKGGITSTSEIHNLETQIEEITTEIVGENYYNKTEVDALLDTKADASSVYTKTQVDSALALKANAADVYTKTQVDTALAAKADAAATTAALATKADKSDTYTKEQVDALIDNIFPTLTASGGVANFTTALEKPFVSITPASEATTITHCGKNLIDVDAWLTSYSIPYIKDGNKYTFNTSGFYNKTFRFSGSDIPITISADVKNITATNGRLELLKSDGTLVTRLDEGRSYISGTASLVRVNYSTSGDMSIENTQIEVGETTTPEYEPYSGVSIPVAQASTLTTNYGMNNVHTDNGNVTVQYKYMSM